MKIADLPVKQARRYIDELKGFEPDRQLLIKVGGGLLADKAAAWELIDGLAEVTSEGIHVLVVHGAGPQLSQAIADNLHHEPRFIDGRRYTDEPTLELAKTVFGAVTNDLIDALQARGVDAVTLPGAGLLKAKRQPELGLVSAEITDIDTARIKTALKHHSVLVLNSLVSDSISGETLNANADTVFRALATKLQPHRMASLTPTGGVLKPIDDSTGQELISGLDIRDVEGLIKEGVVSGGMALKLRELAAILDKLEIGSAISITKPSELLTELLTDQGSGTFIGKGQKILTATNLDDVFDDFSALIKEVFGKSLPPDYQQRPIEKVYYTADRLAFGVVTKLSDGTAYLDKLAVSPQLQGRGIGETLWYRVVKDFPVILWRSHVTNRYATWYHRHADIMKRQGEWVLFGRGTGFDKLETMADELVAIPAMR